MNEINFNIEDIKTMNLSMDVGIKEIYPPIENLEVTPTKKQQVFNHKNSYGYDEVKVNPIPDEYIIPDGTLEVSSNGDVNVTNYKIARVGVYTPPKLQDKSITITENGTQNITFDEGYDGLNSVEIKTTTGKYAPKYISFYYYSGTDLNEELANLDTSNITSMDYMFYNATKLKSLDVSGFNTHNVIQMSSTFRNLQSLTSLDLSSLNTTKVKYMYYTFEACSNLMYLDVRNFTFTNVGSNATGIFDGIPKNCEIIVKDDEQKQWVLKQRSVLTNVKTIAEV